MSVAAGQAGVKYLTSDKARVCTHVVLSEAL